MGRVLGERHQRPLGGGVTGEERLPAVARHGDDVDDRSGDGVPYHQLRAGLNKDERGPRVDREQPVPDLERDVENAATVGRAGGVDQAVDPAEGGIAGVGDGAALRRVRQVAGNENRAATAPREVIRHGVPAFLVAAANHQAPGAGPGRLAGHRLADALGAAGHNDHLAGQIGHAPSSSSR